MKKYRSSLQDIFSNSYSYEIEESIKTFDKERHKVLYSTEFSSQDSFPLDFPEIKFTTHRPEGPWELGYITASQCLKKPISEFIFKSASYNYKLLEFFKKNALCLLRHIYQEEPDCTYLFLYKGVYFNISSSHKGEGETLYISGFSAYSTIETPIPIEDFEEFHAEPPPAKSKIGIIKAGQGSMYVSKIDLKHDQEFSLEYYNDDFETFKNTIIAQLEEKKPGLFLFHGEPGTGKSSAIRYFVDTVKRDFIFVPPQMISQLSSPAFADIITDTHKGSVLVLEDAEKALMERGSEDGFSNSTLVSSILNLTDGLYADLGQLAIIATYNCDRNLIDKALLRKGRLKTEYRFDKLSIEKSQALMDKLGHKHIVSEPMTLADIFNYEGQFTNDVKVEKKAMGFGFGA